MHFFGLGIPEFIVLGACCLMPVLSGVVAAVVYVATRRGPPPDHPGDDRADGR